MPAESTPADPVAEAVKEKLLSAGKIPAIKLYRKMKGAGLAEAKAYVDRLEGKSTFAGRKKSETALSPMAVGVVFIICVAIFLLYYFLAK